MAPYIVERDLEQGELNSLALVAESRLMEPNWKETSDEKLVLCRTAKKVITDGRTKTPKGCSLISRLIATVELKTV